MNLLQILYLAIKILDIKSHFLFKLFNKNSVWEYAVFIKIVTAYID